MIAIYTLRVLNFICFLGGLFLTYLTFEVPGGKGIFATSIILILTMVLGFFTGRDIIETKKELFDKKDV